MSIVLGLFFHHCVKTWSSITIYFHFLIIAVLSSIIFSNVLEIRTWVFILRIYLWYQSNKMDGYEKNVYISTYINSLVIFQYCFNCFSKFFNLDFAKSLRKNLKTNTFLFLILSLTIRIVCKLLNFSTSFLHTQMSFRNFNTVGNNRFRIFRTGCWNIRN